MLLLQPPAGNQQLENRVTAFEKLDLLAMISHEIRNPLNAIIGVSRLLKHSTSEEERNEYIDSLLHTSENLLELVNNIMDFSKLESGKLKFLQKPTDLRKLLKDNLMSQKHGASSKGLDLIIEIDENVPPLVLTDSVKINQVILNLVSNAVKFTSEGTVTVCLKVEKETDSAVAVRFSVRDTGIGIPEAKLEEVFQAFDQGGEEVSLKYGGTGLGLSISKSIVETLGGRFNVDSREGRGSEFSFVLLLQKEEIFADDVPAKEKFTPEHLGKALKILVVDDNKLNLLVVQKQLEFWDFEFETAVNGRDAMARIKEQDFDAVLMDLHMPEMDGIQATREIRKLDGIRYQSLPVIGLSASAGWFDRESIHSAGFTDLLSKPFTSEELLNKIISNLHLKVNSAGCT